MIMFTPIGFTVNKNPGDRDKQKAIFENKKRIVNMPHRDKYFLMRDLDIQYYSGIQEMEAFLDEHDDYGAVALWPYKGSIPREEGPHVSTAFMMVRSAAVKNFNMEWFRGCFCAHLCRHFRNNGWRVKYLRVGEIIHGR